MVSSISHRAILRNLSFDIFCKTDFELVMVFFFFCAGGLEKTGDFPKRNVVLFSSENDLEKSCDLSDRKC